MQVVRHGSQGTAPLRCHLDMAGGYQQGPLQWIATVQGDVPRLAEQSADGMALKLENNGLWAVVNPPPEPSAHPPQQQQHSMPQQRQNAAQMHHPQPVFPQQRACQPDQQRLQEMAALQQRQHWLQQQHELTAVTQHAMTQTTAASPQLAEQPAAASVLGARVAHPRSSGPAQLLPAAVGGSGAPSQVGIVPPAPQSAGGAAAPEPAAPGFASQFSLPRQWDIKRIRSAATRSSNDASEWQRAAGQLQQPLRQEGVQGALADHSFQQPNGTIGQSAQLPSADMAAPKQSPSPAKLVIKRSAVQDPGNAASSPAKLSSRQSMGEPDAKRQRVAASPATAAEQQSRPSPASQRPQNQLQQRTGRDAGLQTAPQPSNCIRTPAQKASSPAKPGRQRQQPGNAARNVVGAAHTGKAANAAAGVAAELPPPKALGAKVILQGHSWPSSSKAGFMHQLACC